MPDMSRLWTVYIFWHIMLSCFSKRWYKFTLFLGIWVLISNTVVPYYNSLILFIIVNMKMEIVLHILFFIFDNQKGWGCLNADWQFILLWNVCVPHLFFSWKKFLGYILRLLGRFSILTLHLLLGSKYFNSLSFVLSSVFIIYSFHNFF